MRELTEPQRRFAEREHATPFLRSGNRGVFLYQNGPVSTRRWLVDREGRILESAAFRRG